MAMPPLEHPTTSLRAMAKVKQKQQEEWNQLASFVNRVVSLWRQGWCQQQFHQQRFDFWRRMSMCFDVIIAVGAGASGSLLIFFSALFGQFGRSFATALAAGVAIIAAARPWLGFTSIMVREQVQVEGWQAQVSTVRVILDELEELNWPISHEPEHLSKILKAASQQKNQLLLKDSSEPQDEQKRVLEERFEIHLEREYEELHGMLG